LAVVPGLVIAMSDTFLAKVPGITVKAMFDAMTANISLTPKWVW
jgi:hypothetical protein